MAVRILKIKNPARKRDWGLLFEHGGDFVLDQHLARYSRPSDGGQLQIGNGH
jgi:hypothetical protein